MSAKPVKTDRTIIVGASSGIGAELARQLAAGGARVALVARRLDLLKALADEINASHKEPVASVYEHDVVQYDKVPGLFRQVVDDLGGLDLIVYASGVMLPTGEDEYNFQKDLQIVEVNLLGCMAWLDEAATMFQRQASGAIMAISSVAGDRGRKKYPAYHTAKAGVTTFVESLRNRLTPLGVRVLTVKPGPVDTAMTAGMKMPFMIGAPQAAAAMLQWLQRPWLQTLYVAYRWWAIMTVIRLLPSFIMRRLNF